jgi:hypothetical protein
MSGNALAVLYLANPAMNFLTPPTLRVGRGLLFTNSAPLNCGLCRRSQRHPCYPRAHASSAMRKLPEPILIYSRIACPPKAQSLPLTYERSARSVDSSQLIYTNSLAGCREVTSNCCQTRSVACLTMYLRPFVIEICCDAVYSSRPKFVLDFNVGAAFGHGVNPMRRRDSSSFFAAPQFMVADGATTNN